MSKLKKIIIGIIAFIVIIVVIAMVATQGISDVARSQLKALKNDDIVKAYSYTSRDFQKATSLDDFKQFVANYPSLKNNADATFTDREIENNTGKLKGSLKSEDGAVTPIEYALVKENGEWKILNMKLNPAGAGIKETETIEREKTPTAGQSKNTQTQSVGKIIDIKLSDQVDSRGVVAKHKSVYSIDTAEINVSAYIESAVTGGKVSADLLHLASNSKVGPVSNPIEEDGDRISNFSFTKPTKGWSEGSYKITITLSSGETKNVSFEVR